MSSGTHWYRKLLKPMIKQDALSKIKFILTTLLIFLFSHIAGVNLAIPAFLLILFYYFKFSYRQHIEIQKALLLNLSFLFVLIFAITHFIIRNGWPIFYIPFALIPMLVTILFDRAEISLFMILTNAVVISTVIANNYYLAIFSLISGFSGSDFRSTLMPSRTISFSKRW